MATLVLRRRARAAAEAAAAASSLAASFLIIVTSADEPARRRRDETTAAVGMKSDALTTMRNDQPTGELLSMLSAAEAASASFIRTRVPSSNAAASLAYSSPCLCEGLERNLSSRRAMSRSQTLRRMDRASTKTATLDSRYHVDTKAPPLGEGAFGAVHLATDRSTGERVALKRMPKCMTDDEAFQREMNALLRIRTLGGHPHICALRESFDEGKDYSLVLDYVSGGEMFDHLIQNGAYSEADASRLVREVASALAFLHGVGIVHADLKPENLMLSTQKATDAVVKLVDFGCAEVMEEEDDEDDEDEAELDGNGDRKSSGSSGGSGGGGITPAYCPPEALVPGAEAARPPMDMWSLGVILYVMLTGVHPFDVTGTTSDEVIEEKIKAGSFPLRNTPMTRHLSDSAIDLIERLMEGDADRRMTAEQMLEHPWVRGLTATKTIIAGSDERLSRLRVYKSTLQAQFFRDAVEWSDDMDDARRKTNLIERAFRAIDEKNRGFLTPQDLGQKCHETLSSSSSSDGDDGNAPNTDESGGAQISMSDFHNLLSENMQQKNFPRGTIVYREGDIGNHMYFINSGTIEVVTKDGSRATRTQGDFFGEGALLHPKKVRSATIRCKTPVQVMEVSREYFEKYLATSESGLLLTLREKDKIRKRNRAKAILKLQNNLVEMAFQRGEKLFAAGEDTDFLFIVKSGKVDIVVGDKTVFAATPGNICGEHSVLTGQIRNSTAVCVTEGGCKALKMLGRDFRRLTDSSPEIRTSLMDLNNRRDFKKAVVFRLKKEFPYHNPREAFNAVKRNKGGDDVLSVDDIGNLMKEMDPSYSDKNIIELIQTIDLTNSGDVTFDEFRKVFIANVRTSASI